MIIPPHLQASSITQLGDPNAFWQVSLDWTRIFCTTNQSANVTYMWTCVGFGISWQPLYYSGQSPNVSSIVLFWETHNVKTASLQKKIAIQAKKNYMKYMNNLYGPPFIPPCNVHVITCQSLLQFFCMQCWNNVNVKACCAYIWWYIWTPPFNICSRTWHLREYEGGTTKWNCLWLRQIREKKL